MLSGRYTSLVWRSLSASALALPMLYAAVGCAVGREEGGNRGIPAAAGIQGGVGIYRYQSPAERAESARLRASVTSGAAAGAHLTYYGGKVISNVEVVAVNWGPNVNATVKSGIGGFYSAVTNSSYFDWLSEYSTVGVNGADGAAGSNQSIGRGTYYGQVTITPSNTSTSLADADIQNELQAQIASGVLPAPNGNRIYMIDFPPGISISNGGGSSCVSGGFCAYHGTLTISGQSVPYGVMPDMSPGSGCDTGCGSDPTMFNNSTSVHSHELIEAVTDMEVGIGTSVGRPLAWYDSTNGEIGDICNGEHATVAGYTVQKEWSNRQGACVVSGPSSATYADFTISAAAATATAGASTSTSITTANSGAGSAQTIALTATGLPAGATGTFAPTSVTGGGTSTLTINTGAAAAGSYAVTVHGAGNSTTHTANFTLTINASGGGGGGGGGTTITNGDFETGTTSGWATTGVASIAASGFTGSHSLELGSTAPSTDSTASQTFTAPSTGGTLSFHYKVICPDTITYDWASATLKDNTAGTTSTILANTCTNSGTWQAVTATLTASHSYTLTLANHDDNYAGDATYTYYDSVTVTAGSSGGGGGGGGGGGSTGITDGGFESSLTGWTTAGTTSASTAKAHSGTHAALCGSSSPTNGDSSVSQTFTAPTGSSKLTFWYFMVCNDTVTYDWATATLHDNTTGATTTVLAKTCSSSSAWTQITAAITAGHSYTLTLTNHDDNYAGDATYTYFDDVSTL